METTTCMVTSDLYSLEKVSRLCTNKHGVFGTKGHNVAVRARKREPRTNCCSSHARTRETVELFVSSGHTGSVVSFRQMRKRPGVHIKEVQFFPDIGGGGGQGLPYGTWLGDSTWVSSHKACRTIDRP